jgi:prevent-host-death family protein
MAAEQQMAWSGAKTLMFQDFGLLSMTELRNRPGEILDRVSEGGESFIIERSGSQKACLVPLSAFFPDIPPAKIADEIEELERHGEEPRTTITEKRELTFRFTHRLADNRRIEVAIVLPHGYPNTCPRVYVNPIHVDAPHKWADGALCLYGVMSGWNPGKHSVQFTLSLAKRWLQHYDAWLQSGLWPKPEGTQDEG